MSDGRLALTFDDGYATDYEDIYPVLDDRDAPASLAVVADWLGEEGTSPSNSSANSRTTVGRSWPTGGNTGICRPTASPRTPAPATSASSSTATTPSPRRTTGSTPRTPSR
ncbi:polysaccharide deacetylase family protein [Halosimplex aquaticum]